MESFIRFGKLLWLLLVFTLLGERCCCGGGGCVFVVWAPRLDDPDVAATAAAAVAGVWCVVVVVITAFLVFECSSFCWIRIARSPNKRCLVPSSSSMVSDDIPGKVSTLDGDEFAAVESGLASLIFELK